MPLFKKRDESERDASPEQREASSPLRAHIEDEIWRSQRYQRPLVLLCVFPQLLPGELADAGDLAAATDLLSRQLRRSDRVGVIGDAVVAVLSETDAFAARSVAHRVAGELTRASARDRRRNWLGGVASPTDDTNSVELLLAAAKANALRDRAS